MKKHGLEFAAAALLVAMTTLALTPAAGSTDDRPNVLLVFIDDLRPMTRDYGHGQMQTPNFDRLARSGVRFENAYCQVPTCGASRASLMTSIYPTVERFPNFLTWAERDAPGRPTLPQRFREAGYTTISNGKVFHHKNDTQDRSWSEPAWRPETSGRTYYNDATREFMETQTETRRPRNGRPRKKFPMFEAGLVDAMETHDGRIARKTMEDLERLAGDEAPFFIACGFAKPHMPFYAPASKWQKYPLEDIDLAEHRERPQPVPKTMRQVREQYAYSFVTPSLDRKLEYNGDPFHRYMRQGYYACVSHADDLLGRILDKLAQLELDDNTYVVVLGDHGFMLGEHNEWAKNQLLHDALRTAMWMTGPGIAKNAAAKSHIEFVDIYPTLCELAGIGYEPDSVNGRSFSRLLKDPSVEHRNHAYTRFEHGDAITTDDYYYARWQLDGGAEEALLIDRTKDPHGVRNVSGQPDYASVEASLRQKVLAKMASASRIEIHPRNVGRSATTPNSPQVANQPLTLEATIQSERPSGVVLSQGGYRFGYSLHFVDGRPTFSLRTDGELTEIQGEDAVAGRVTVTAKLDAERMSLLVDGRNVASQASPGLLARQPIAAFSVGEDAGDPVGKYQGSDQFNGEIVRHQVRTGKDSESAEPSAVDADR